MFSKEITSDNPFFQDIKKNGPSRAIPINSRSKTTTDGITYQYWEDKSPSKDCSNNRIENKN